MRELALHLLDIAENSVAAQAKNIRITIEEDTCQDTLRMLVVDDGVGMSPELVAKVIDPFTTSRTTRKVGLGTPLLKAAAEACEGWLKIDSAPGAGTTVEVVFKRSHIDRMPLGNLAETFLTLFIGTPDVHWLFEYRIDSQEFLFDDVVIKDELQGVPLSEPDVISFVRDYIQSGIESVKSQD